MERLWSDPVEHEIFGWLSSPDWLGGPGAGINGGALRLGRRALSSPPTVVEEIL